MNKRAQVPIVSPIPAMIASQNAQRIARENRRRRKLHQGSDQILIKSKKSVSLLKKEIAKLFCNWEVHDGEITQVNELNFSSMIPSFISFTIIILLGRTAWWIFTDDYRSPHPFLTMGISIFLIILILGLSFIWRIMNAFEEIDYIQVRTLDKENYIVVKVYDSNGYRNIDEIDILKIEKIAGAGK